MFADDKGRVKESLKHNKTDAAVFKNAKRAAPNKEVQRTNIRFEHGELGESYEGKLERPERERTIDDAANRTAPLRIVDSYDRPNTS